MFATCSTQRKGEELCTYELRPLMSETIHSTLCVSDSTCRVRNIQFLVRSSR